MRPFVTRLGAAIVLLGVCAAAGIAQGGVLDDLPLLKDYKAKRISSNDPTGGNADAWRIDPGQTATLAQIEGSGCITHIWFTIASGEPEFPRKLVLRMYWDGEQNPSVEAPVGDFFCVGHGMQRNVNSLPIRVSSDGRARNCFFKMPFGKGAKITVTNEGLEPVGAFYFYIDYRVNDSVPDDMPRFHAQYRQEFPCEPGHNYLILDAEGKGHYVGCNESIVNRAPGWWGEGDDMIYVDGETDPSFKGTGSEDYFCDAWGMREQEGLFYGCPLEEGFEPGDKATVYRWHIEDPIPFTKSIRVTIEHGHANDRSDDFSSVVYWYQDEPHKPFPPLPPMAERLPRPVLSGDVLEMEDAEIVTYVGDKADLSAEVVRPRDAGMALSGNSAVKIPVPGPGARTVVRLVPPHADNYRVVLEALSGPDSGRFDYCVTPEPTEPSKWPDPYRPKKESPDPWGLDLYSGTMRRPPPQDLGTYYLKPGEYWLQLECVGKSDESKGFGVVLDAVSLIPNRKFITDWWVIGPFDLGATEEELSSPDEAPPGFEIPYGPEQKIDFEKDYPGKGDEWVSWKEAKANPDGFLDLNQAIGPEASAVAYAACEFTSSQDLDTPILVGSDDGCKVWLNGKLVFAKHIWRGAEPDQDFADVHLSKGTNRILLKVENTHGGWGFYCRIPAPENVIVF
jgi:hypothetical protein